MDFNKDKDEPQEFIKYSLALYLWLRLSKEEPQILKKFEQALNNREFRKVIQARVNEITRYYETQLLIEKIKKELQEILKEKKWLKFTLMTTQLFGLTLCGILLKDAFNYPIMSLTFKVSAIGFIITTIVSIVLALWKK
ncbi:MAG: hypothetical protein LWW90_06365 [Candidatus Desulfofervidus auxilii]|nr:hypothetical protein [Candidatus Desulfofervidus auxilii]